MRLKKLVCLMFATSCLLPSVGLSSSGQEKPVVNILFLGKTGVGKSTLINVFYNHIKGNSYESEREIIIPLVHARWRQFPVNVERFKVYDVKLNAAGRSQTADVHVYPVESEHYVINLWDAPGVLDVAGADVDRSNIDKIATALGDKTVNAVVVVLNTGDADRDGVEVEAAINSLCRMLPKSFQKNIIGVFNRASGLQRSTRLDLSKWFQGLFHLDRAVEEITSFIDGSSFFDVLGDADEDERLIGKMRWTADAAAVAKVVELAAKNSPASGTDAKLVHDTQREIEQRMKDLAQKIRSLQALTIDIQLKANDLRNSIERRDANKDFEKTLTVDVKVYDVEWHGWWIFGGPATVERIHTETRKQIDEGQRVEYERSLANIENVNEKIEFCKKEVERLEEQKRDAVREIKSAQKKLEESAITTGLDPYINYLEAKLRYVESDRSLTSEERGDQIRLYRNWLKEYQDMRIGVSHL